MTDFDDALADLGITEDELNAHNAAYPVAKVDLEALGVRIGPSEIHGNGVFAEKPVMPGCLFLPVVLNDALTDAGAAVNHSPDANCALAILPHGNMYLESLTWIDIGDEITQNYRHIEWRPHK